MRDEISPEERAAIDAFPKSRIRRFMPGETGATTRYRWCEKLPGKHSGGLVIANMESLPKRAVARMKAAASGAAKANNRRSRA